MLDTPVGLFAQAVATSTSSERAIPGSPAATYLAYLTTMADLTGQITGEVTELSDDGFVLVQPDGREALTYDRFEVSDLGITNFHLDGRPMASIVSVVARPIVHPSGVDVLEGFSFTSFGANRVVVLRVRNGTGGSLWSAPASSALTERTGTRLPATDHELGGPIEIPPGEIVTVVTLFPRGDADPTGILEQAFLTTDPSAPVVVQIPLTGAQPTFFELDPSGILRGQLDADIAFETGSAEPSDTALDILYKAALEIATFDPRSPICVAGFADSVGDATSNQVLSEARAETVAAALVGYDVANELSTVGYGETHAPGHELPDPDSRRVDVAFANCADLP